jgi:hypothetical protein
MGFKQTKGADFIGRLDRLRKREERLMDAKFE